MCLVQAALEHFVAVAEERNFTRAALRAASRSASATWSSPAAAGIRMSMRPR
jgi:hypothetical protein